jgi:Polyketide cyclase / dehydrase and lipid transport
MAHINGEITIHRPVAEVFDFVADERNEPRYNPGMVRAELLTPEPVGRGGRFRAEMRTRPRPVVMTTENTGFDRPRRLASTTRLSTMDIEGTLTLTRCPPGPGCDGPGRCGRAGCSSWPPRSWPASGHARSGPSGRASSGFWKGRKLPSPLTGDRLLPGAPRRSR